MHFCRLQYVRLGSNSQRGWYDVSEPVVGCLVLFKLLCNQLEMPSLACLTQPVQDTSFYTHKSVRGLWIIFHQLRLTS